MDNSATSVRQLPTSIQGNRVPDGQEDAVQSNEARRTCRRSGDGHAPARSRAVGHEAQERGEAQQEEADVRRCAQRKTRKRAAHEQEQLSADASPITKEPGAQQKDE
jgi:hypothetical protein